MTHPPSQTCAARARPRVKLAALGTIAVIYALAAGLRAAYVAQTRHDPLTRDLAKGTDMEVFDRIAIDALGGRWLFAGSASDSPLYPCLFLPAVYSLTGGNVHQAAAVQGAFGALLAALTFLLAWRLYGEAAASFAGLIVALYAPLIVYDCALLGEALLNVLSAASLAGLIYAASRPHAWRCAAAGLVLLGYRLLRVPGALSRRAPVPPAAGADAGVGVRT